jgi:hypothetical protein
VSFCVVVIVRCVVAFVRVCPGRSAAHIDRVVLLVFASAVELSRKEIVSMSQVASFQAFGDVVHAVLRSLKADLDKKNTPQSQQSLIKR